jgi:hypothetical protein
MSCCGEAKEKDATNGQVQHTSQPAYNTIISQPAFKSQPTYPGHEFQPPSVSPPPAVHPNAFPQNTFRPLLMNEFGAMPPSQTTTAVHVPTFTGTTYNGSNFDVANGFSSINQSIARPPSSHSPHSPPPQTDTTIQDEGKMSISIDFGTTFSGVAYGSSRIAGGQVQQILNWPGSFETFRKIPTCLLYDEYGQVLAWGLEAKNAGPIPGTTLCEWFKLFLEPQALRDESAIDPRLPTLPPGKRAVDLIIDFLSCLWEYAKDQITRDIGAVADLNSADVWLTVPAAWDAKGSDIMRDAAITAGLVQSSRAGDITWRDRLRIITEPEAAAVHCARLTDLHHLKPSQNFIVADAGGGTVDLAVYKIIGQMANLEIAEICARSGANCGSIFLDLRFRELVKALLADHPAHLDGPSLAYFMHSFSETDKLNYVGIPDDGSS